MANEIIFQNWIFKDFLLPFILIFALLFAFLEKTKVLGDGKHQLDAIVSFVVALIFVGFLSPKEIVSNMILFLAVALVVLFVFVLLYGFVAGDAKGFAMEKWMKYFLTGVVLISVIVAVFWATGFEGNRIIDFLFRQDWSNSFWTNAFFIVVFAAVVAWVVKSAK